MEINPGSRIESSLMKKWSGKKHLYEILLMALIVCLCGGCGNAQEEVMSDSVSAGVGVAAEAGGAKNAGQAAAAEDGTEKNVGQETAAEVGAETNVGQAAAAEDGRSKDAGSGGVNAVSGNLLGQVGAETQMTKEKVTTPAESEMSRREPVKVKGIYVSGPVAGIARMDDLIELVDQTELNAMVIDIKNDEGKVTYKMQSEQVQAIGAAVGYIPDIEELVKKCKEKGIYLIARIVAFRDPYLAEKMPEWAVHTKNGEIFRDKSGLAWVNPYERGVWDYLVEIASEAAAVGFDEIQFDYIRFSTDVKTEEVDYGPEDERIGKIGIITEFTEYMYEKLSQLGVYVAADVFGTVIENETDQQIVGQDYVKMAEHLDYICPMVYPSHYRNGSYGIAVPDADPYKTINEACSASVQELATLPEENRARVRTWLQSFTASWVPGHISYGPQQIRAQIKGAYDAGYDEWILWNAAVKYQRDSLLTEEEAEAERLQWDAEKNEAEQRARQEEAERQVAEKEQAGEAEVAGQSEAAEEKETKEQAGETEVAGQSEAAEEKETKEQAGEAEATGQSEAVEEKEIKEQPPEE